MTLDPAKSASAMRAADGSKSLIGLVEDSDADAHLFKRAFAGVADVRRWPDGESLLAAVLDDPSLLSSLAALVLDLSLPGIDGVHIAHTLRNAPSGRDLPIVVLSGSSAETDILRALDADVTEYEVKAADVRGLRAFVERTMGLVEHRSAGGPGTPV